jgi:branched-subunit amino acid transport protein
MEFSSVVISAPVSSSFSKTFLRRLGLIPLIHTLPPVTAAATKYVPASILSAGMLKNLNL